MSSATAIEADFLFARYVAVVFTLTVRCTFLNVGGGSRTAIFREVSETTANGTLFTWAIAVLCSVAVFAAVVASHTSDGVVAGVLSVLSSRSSTRRSVARLMSYAFVVAMEIDFTAAGAIAAIVALRVLRARTLVATVVLRTRATLRFRTALRRWVTVLPAVGAFHLSKIIGITTTVFASFFLSLVPRPFAHSLVRRWHHQGKLFSFEREKEKEKENYQYRCFLSYTFLYFLDRIS